MSKIVLAMSIALQLSVKVLWPACVLWNSSTGQLAHFNPATLQSTTMADYPEVHPELVKYHNID